MNSENILEYTANKDLTLASRMLPKALENKDYEALKVAVTCAVDGLAALRLIGVIKKEKDVAKKTLDECMSILSEEKV